MEAAVASGGAIVRIEHEQEHEHEYEYEEKGLLYP